MGWLELQDVDINIDILYENFDKDETKEEFFITRIAGTAKITLDDFTADVEISKNQEVKKENFQEEDTIIAIERTEPMFIGYFLRVAGIQYTDLYPSSNGELEELLHIHNLYIHPFQGKSIIEVQLTGPKVMVVKNVAS